MLFRASAPARHLDPGQVPDHVAPMVMSRPRAG